MSARLTPEYWQARWREGRTGWQQSAPHPALQQFGAAMQLKPGDNVLVPACGASPDLLWLASTGATVIGVEVCALAVSSLLATHRLAYQRKDHPHGECYHAQSGRGRLKLWRTDLFALSPRHLPEIDWVYDRAALVAFDAETRPAYATQLQQLAPRARQLLITLDRPDAPRDHGPPFAVPVEEIARLYPRYGLTALTAQARPRQTRNQACERLVWLDPASREPRLAGHD